MAEAVAAPFLGKLAELLVEPISRQFCYLFQYRSNIENLKDELDRLQATRKGVRIQVDAAEYNLETVDPVMQSWAKRVNVIETKASGVIQRSERTANVDNKCMNVGCPNVKRRYLLSKDARKLTRSIVILKGEGRSYAKSTYSAPPPGIVTADALLPELSTRIDATPFIRSCEDLGSRKSIFKQVMCALKDDTIRMIGISGTGGVGKTTFVNEVCQKARAQNLIEQLAMTAVSQKQELLKIQDELAEMLGLKFTEEKTILARAHRLRSRLTNGRKILVILDDVWDEIPLKQVGIPVTGDRGGCKVIFTSRDKHLFSDMGTQLNLTLEALTCRESRDLFRRNIGGCKKHLAASEIVDTCEGLPIAIVTLAKALRKEEAATWEYALNHLKPFTEAESSEVHENAAYKSVKLSYNLMKDKKAKALLVLCCLFPEDANIQLEILFKFHRSSNIEVKRRNVSYLVGKLRSNNLLGEGYRPGTVKVHDIVRDVCLTTEGLNKWPQDHLSFAAPPADLLENVFSFRVYEYAEVLYGLNDDRINRIGIYGEGGIGKTKMAYDIRKKVLADNLFDEVVMTIVSENKDMRKVQDELGGILGLASTIIWYKGTDVSTRAQLLRKRLTNGRKILVILDDVWENIDLESIGVPDTGEISGCKVVFMARNKSICSDMQAQMIIKLNILTDEEGWQLFKDHARLPKEETSETGKFYSIGRKIVCQSRKVPLIVIILARTLKNRRFEDWRYAHEKLSCGTFDEIYEAAIQLSYEMLGDPEAQSLLLLCCIIIWGSSKSIPMEKLVECVHRVQLFVNGYVMRLEDTRFRVYSLADVLQDAYLLQPGRTYGPVALHYLVRDVCISLARAK